MEHDTFPRLSRKEFDILKYLVDKGGERYGLEMVEDSGGTLKKGTVYVTLQRLEDKGYIKSRKENPRPSARGLPRRMYKLSAEGHRVIELFELFQGSTGRRQALA